MPQHNLTEILVSSVTVSIPAYLFMRDDLSDFLILINEIDIKEASILLKMRAIEGTFVQGVSIGPPKTAKSLADGWSRRRRRGSSIFIDGGGTAPYRQSRHEQCRP
jgi:hypothetical protein